MPNAIYFLRKKSPASYTFTVFCTGDTAPVIDDITQTGVVTHVQLSLPASAGAIPTGQTDGQYAVQAFAPGGTQVLIVNWTQGSNSGSSSSIPLTVAASKGQQPFDDPDRPYLFVDPDDPTGACYIVLLNSNAGYELTGEVGFSTRELSNGKVEVTEVVQVAPGLRKTAAYTVLPSVHVDPPTPVAREDKKKKKKKGSNRNRRRYAIRPKG